MVMPETADLLEETAILKAITTASEAHNLRKDKRIARLEKLVAAFNGMIIRPSSVACSLEPVAFTRSIFKSLKAEFV